MYRSFISLNLFPLLLSLSGLSRSIYRLSRKGGEKNEKGKEKERKIQAWIMTNGVLIEEWTLDLEAFLSSSNAGFSRANDARRSLTRRVHDLFGSCIRFDWNSNKFVFDVSFEILQNYIPFQSFSLGKRKEKNSEKFIDIYFPTSLHDCTVQSYTTFAYFYQKWMGECIVRSATCRQ